MATPISNSSEQTRYEFLIYGSGGRIDFDDTSDPNEPVLTIVSSRGSSRGSYGSFKAKVMKLVKDRGTTDPMKRDGGGNNVVDQYYNPLD